MADDNRLALINNIITSHQEYFRENMSVDLKEKMVKAGFHQMLCELLDALNKEFDDVRFKFCWGYERTGRCADNCHELSGEIYDEDYNSDGDEFNNIFDGSYEPNYLDETSVEDLYVTIKYYWERRCNLGCNHLTKRFHIYHAPKLLDLLTFFKLNPPIRTLVKEYIPDFFYDPTLPKPKRGRPRKT